MNWAAALAIIATPGAAVAQEACTGMPSSLLAAPSLASHIAAAKSANLVKDEFETTEAFNKRVAAAGSGLERGPFAVVLPGKADISFDADTSTVSVSYYALSTTCMVFESALSAEAKAVQFGAPPKKIGSYTSPGTAYCMTADISRTSGKPYEASNSYGAKVTVTPVTVQQVGIFFGMGDLGQELIEAKMDRSTYKRDPAFKFVAPVEDARSLKENAAIAFLVEPKAPFYVKGTYSIAPKIDSPTELFMHSDMLVATPLCAAIVDRKTGRVFATKPVQPVKEY